MRLGVDLDGVVHPFVPAATACVERARGLEPGSLTPDPEWNFYGCWGMDDKEFWSIIREAYEREEIWWHDEPEPGAREALTLLRKEGHSIHICTNRIGYELGTVSWLLKFRVPFDSITISKDKTILDVDLMVDDYLGNIDALTAADIPVVIFDQPWNRTPTPQQASTYEAFGVARVCNWLEYVEFVRSFDNEAVLV